MKINNSKVANFLFILSLALVAASCVSTDDVTPAVPGDTDLPTVNPLASLSPSSNFDWEMYDNQNATIAIADRYDNKLNYILQVFDEKPTTGVSPIAVGTARGNSPLTVSLDINQRGTLLYVRQIDPAGRTETFSFEKPIANASTLHLYGDASDKILVEPIFTEEEKKIIEEEDQKYKDLLAKESVSSTNLNSERGMLAATTKAATNFSVDFEAPSKPTNLIKASSYPPDAKVDFPDSGTSSWNYSGDYVIKEGDSKQIESFFQFSSISNANIYVAGTLSIPSSLALYNINIYVLPTGKLLGANLDLLSSAKLYIAKGGQAELYSISELSDTQIVVDGTLKADEIVGDGADPILYVGSTGEVTVTNKIRGFYSYIYVDASKTDANSGKLSCASLHLDYTNTVFVVKENAQLKVSGEIYNRGVLHNEGLVSSAIYNGGQLGVIYNTCTIIVTSKLSEVKVLYMRDASLSGEREENSNELKPIPLVELNYDYFYLFDGSYVYIDYLNHNRLSVQGGVIGTNEEASLLRLNRSNTRNTHSWVTQLVKLWIGEQYQDAFRVTRGASIFHNAQDVPYDIENCSGIVVEQIPAEPTEPELIDGSLKGHYTVNFEDKWPQYGDYDLNDIVYHIGSVKTVQTTEGVINKLTVNMQLLAVGATFHLAMGLQMPTLKGSDIQEITVSSLGQVGATFDELGFMVLDGGKSIEQAGATDPVVIPLFYDAHAFLRGVISQRNMIGTGGTKVTPRDLTVEITFATGANIDASKLGIDDFDFFMYKPADAYSVDGKRVEVHMKNYLPTINGSDSYFGTSDDASVLASGNTYRSATNFPWAVRVMDNTEETTVDEEVTAVQVPWKWVVEGKSILVAYPEFSTWVNSGRDTDTGWSSAK